MRVQVLGCCDRRDRHVSRRFGSSLACLTLLTFALSGCGESSAPEEGAAEAVNRSPVAKLISEADVPDPSRSTDQTASKPAAPVAQTTSRPQVEEEKSSANKSSSAKGKSPAEPESVVPGTHFVAPVDDAIADGWQTEQLSSAAGKQLKKLASKFSGARHASASPGEAKEHEVAGIAAMAIDAVVFSPLRPELKTIFSDAAFDVRQRLTDAPADRHGVVDLKKELTHYLDFVQHPSLVHTKVKVFRVSEVEQKEGLQFQTSAYMQTWGDCDRGAFQVNATWDCVWKIVDRKLQLASLKVRDYFDVVGTASANGGPMFADCTEAILGQTPAFKEQLLPSMDQWLHTVEIQYQINIGGWEGVSIADVNGDGLDDLYLCQPGGLPNRLFLQMPDGTCQDYSADSATDWLNQSHGSLFADLDNDGDQDLIVGVHDGLVIMANDGDGHFVVRAGQILPAAIPYSIAVADYDQDGRLDIYACCYDRRSGVNRHRIFAKAIPYHDANNGGRNVLLRNESTEGARWGFRYVTERVGLDQNNRRFSYAGAWEDYDNDGDLDLYVANDFGRNCLYRNDGGTFQDVAAEAGVEDISAGMSVSWGDYNNDGWMDLYVSNMFSSAGNRIAFQRKFQADADGETREQFKRHARGNTLFENAKDGTFRDVSTAANVTLGRWAWGSRFLDLNNDGWLDLYVSNGFLTQSDPADL